MSHYMTALAMKQTGLKPATKIVLYWLADHHNGETNECFPSHKRLAELCEMTDRSIRTHLEELQSAGLIQIIERKRDNGSQTSNSYNLLLTEADTPRKNFPTLMENIATQPRKNLPTHNLVSNNLGNRTNYMFNNFEEIWIIYPKKQGKGAARKSYERSLTKINPNILFDRIKEYVEAIKGKDIKYIPMLSTWLNQERWDDDVPKSENIDANFRSMVNDLARVQR